MKLPDVDQIKGGNPSQCVEMILDQLPTAELKKTNCADAESYESMC